LVQEVLEIQVVHEVLEQRFHLHLQRLAAKSVATLAILGYNQILYT
jgi:hypothetical protein